MRPQGLALFAPADRRWPGRSGAPARATAWAPRRRRERPCGAALKPYRKFSHGVSRRSRGRYVLSRLMLYTARQGSSEARQSRGRQSRGREDRAPSECDRQKIAELTPDGRLGPSRPVTYSAHSWATRSMNSGRVNPLRHQLSARTCSADGCGSVRLVMAKPDLRSSSV